MIENGLAATIQAEKFSPLKCLTLQLNHATAQCLLI